MAELWPSVTRRILPRSFKPQPLAAPHDSPCSVIGTNCHCSSSSTTKPPSDPTVGASSTQPEDFFPMIPENQPQNHIASFLKSMSATPLNEDSLPSSTPTFISIYR